VAAVEAAAVRENRPMGLCPIVVAGLVTARAPPRRPRSSVGVGGG